MARACLCRPARDAARRAQPDVDAATESQNLPAVTTRTVSILSRFLWLEAHVADNLPPERGVDARFDATQGKTRRVSFQGCVEHINSGRRGKLAFAEAQNQEMCRGQPASALQRIEVDLGHVLLRMDRHCGHDVHQIRAKGRPVHRRSGLRDQVGCTDNEAQAAQQQHQRGAVIPLSMGPLGYIVPPCAGMGAFRSAHRCSSHHPLHCPDRFPASAPGWPTESRARSRSGLSVRAASGESKRSSNPCRMRSTSSAGNVAIKGRFPRSSSMSSSAIDRAGGRRACCHCSAPATTGSLAGQTIQKVDLLAVQPAGDVKVG